MRTKPYVSFWWRSRCPTGSHEVPIPKEMQDLNDFYNDGFGWICRHCERELAPEPEHGSPHSRFFVEGESESKSPRLSNPALARWADPARTTLVCPRCGITELTEKA